jgi:nucleolar complex protein 3
MAEIGSGLLADPEGNLSTLKELQEMCKDRDDSVAQLALLSSMAVFKDLLPGWVMCINRVLATDGDDCSG